MHGKSDAEALRDWESEGGAPSDLREKLKAGSLMRALTYLGSGRRSGDSPSNERFETQMVPASDRREKGYMGHLANYYEEIVSVVRGAESVFIFGPGEAKGELRKHFHKQNLSGRIVGFETADKMTKRQVAHKVRNFYIVAPAISLTNGDQD